MGLLSGKKETKRERFIGNDNESDSNNDYDDDELIKNDHDTFSNRQALSNNNNNNNNNTRSTYGLMVKVTFVLLIFTWIYVFVDKNTFDFDFNSKNNNFTTTTGIDSTFSTEYGVEVNDDLNTEKEEENIKDDKYRPTTDDDDDDDDDEEEEEEENEDENENENENENAKVTTKKKKNKFIAIHIGPHKTGTTSIQHDSDHVLEYQNSLKEDNVVYIGRGARMFGGSARQRVKIIKKIFACMVKRYNNDNNYDNLLLLDANNNNVEYEKQKLKLQKLLLDECVPTKYQYIFQYNILDSDESNSKMIPDYFKISKKNKNKIDRNINYINKIRHNILFDIFDYTEIIFIGVYRPYAERLVSSYKEFTKIKCLNQQVQKCLNIWDDFTMKFVEKQNDYSAHMMHFNTTSNIDNTLLNLIPKYIPYAKIKILYYFVLKEQQLMDYASNNNNYNCGSITTDLYCNGLGLDRTPKTCQLSKENDLLGHDIRHVGHSSEIIYYHDIIYEGITSHPNWGTNTTDISSLLSSLTASNNSTASSSTTMSQSAETITLWDELEQYHTKILGMNAKNNLPLICPSKNQLEILLQKSLQFEELILNNDKSPLPSSSETATIEQQDRQQLKQIIREQHIQNFWKLSLEKKSFCSLDVEKLFGSNNNKNNVSSWEQLFNERLRIETW